ncbi:hypothetical protein IAU59_002088 [Kwoniella sp. CBS 9459]
MSMLNGRHKLPQSAIHQAAALVDASGHRAVPNSSFKGKERQCISCGRCWPWTVFDVEVFHHTSHVCTRCARPDLDVQRWSQLHDEMTYQVLEARKKLIRRRNAAVQSDSATTSRSTSVFAPTAFADDVQAGPSAVHTNGKGKTAGSSVADQYLKRGPGQNRLLDDEALEQLRMKLTPKDWGEIREPERAKIWLQMNFCPAPPLQTIRQVDVFSSYTRLINSTPSNGFSGQPSSKQLNPALDGIDLIKLCLKLWSNAGVEMHGAPSYTLSGLQARPDAATPLLPTASTWPMSQLSHHTSATPHIDLPTALQISDPSANPGSLQPTSRTTIRPPRAKSPTLKGKERAIEIEDQNPKRSSTINPQKRRRSSGVPEGVEVITIGDDDEDEDEDEDEDDGGDDDEWGMLRPKKRVRTNDMMNQRLSGATMITGDLTVQPKPRTGNGSCPSSRAASVFGDDKPRKQIWQVDDGLDIDDDPIEVGDSGKNRPTIQPTQEEEIDELDEDDDPIVLPDVLDTLPSSPLTESGSADGQTATSPSQNLSAAVGKMEQKANRREERASSLSSEAEVGDLLL